MQPTESACHAAGVKSDSLNCLYGESQRTRQTAPRLMLEPLARLDDMRSFILTIVVLGVATSVFAQPAIIVSFTPPPSYVFARDCPGPILADLYVIAIGFNRFISGVQLAIEYPSHMIWLADTDTPPVHLGDSPSGIAMAWATPLNGFEPVLLFKPRILWACTDCSETMGLLQVVGHPLLGGLKATDWPNFDLVDVNGGRSWVCFTSPVSVEESTWGRIKSVYRGSLAN